MIQPFSRNTITKNELLCMCKTRYIIYHVCDIPVFVNFALWSWYTPKISRTR